MVLLLHLGVIDPRIFLTHWLKLTELFTAVWESGFWSESKRTPVECDKGLGVVPPSWM